MPDHSDTAPTEWPDSYPEGYAVVDVETTGLARDDRIVSAAVYRLDARGGVQDHWYTTVNPQRDPGPVWIHGLTAESLVDAPLFPEIAEELTDRLQGRVLVAHHAIFDWSMLSREYARAGCRAPTSHRLCTIHLAKEIGLPLPNYRLEALAAYYGVVQRRAHHALDDARVLAEVFRPSLHRAARAGLPLPLHECRPLAAPPAPRAGSGEQEALDAHASYGSYGAARPPRPGPSGWGPPRTWRPARRRPPCPHPNPGRLQRGGPLVQGMRVAFSGDTSVDREELEDRATETGLHVAGSVSRLTSLLVTNYPDSPTTKVRKAAEVGTPVVNEAAFLELLKDVRPAQATQAAGARPPAPRRGDPAPAAGREREGSGSPSGP